MNVWPASGSSDKPAPGLGAESQHSLADQLSKVVRMHLSNLLVNRNLLKVIVVGYWQRWPVLFREALQVVVVVEGDGRDWQLWQR